MSRARSRVVPVLAAVVMSGLGWTTTAIAQIFQAGDEGAAVRDIQRALGLPVDGFYGVGTEQAVFNFQLASGLRCVDGITGPETLQALGLGFLITNPEQPCGAFAGFPPTGGGTFPPAATPVPPIANLPPASSSNVCPPNVSGSYVAIIPSNTWTSSADLVTAVRRVSGSTAVSLRGAPQGGFVQAGRFNTFKCAEAQAAFLRAAGFDARAVYRP
jgi:hypothetical protein